MTRQLRMSTAYEFGGMPSFGLVHHARKEASSSSEHDSTVFRRRSASNSGSEGEMQLLRQLYMNFLRALRHQYLEDLLEMQALCTLLCGIHSPAQTQMRTLQQLNEKHLRPMVEQLQEPTIELLKRQIRRRDVDRLIRLKDLAGPFIQDFSQTAHALRRQAFQAKPFYDTGKYAAAAAA